MYPESNNKHHKSRIKTRSATIFERLILTVCRLQGITQEYSKLRLLLFGILGKYAYLLFSFLLRVR